MTGLPGEFHALVNGCVGRNAIEVPQLKGAKTERDEHFGIELGIGALKKRPD